MKTLYVTDLDGTLLNSQCRLSDYTVRTINELVESGVLFTYATARSLSSASKVAAGLSARIPIIAYNGAMTVEPSNGRVLSMESFSSADTQRVIDELRRLDISPLVYSLIDGRQRVSWVKGHETEGVSHYIESRRGDDRLRPLASEDGLFDGEVFYFTCIGEKVQLEPLYEALSDDERFVCTLQQEIYREEYWCEIMPKGATKASAIKRLSELWGCERIVSFGDAINDLSMFAVSDECYAVANAVDELKSRATAVIGANDADGVARWLAEHAVEFE